MANLVLHKAASKFRFHVMREKGLIADLLGDSLPDDGEVIKLVSYGGFSSIGFIRFVADKCCIHTLQASSLRIGRRHLQALDAMRQQGTLQYARFVIGSVMKNDSARGKIALSEARCFMIFTSRFLTNCVGR